MSVVSGVPQSAPNGAPPASFREWAGISFDGAPAGIDRTENGNPDGDDYTNIQEFLFVLDPLVADSPALTITSSLSSNSFVVEYLARNSDSRSVRAAWSGNLEPGSWRYDGDGLTETLLETINGIERRSASVAVDADQKFIRLEIHTNDE